MGSPSGQGGLWARLTATGRAAYLSAVIIEHRISEKDLLARYAAGERKFSNVEIRRGRAGVLDGAILDGIELAEFFLASSLRGASLRFARLSGNVKTCDFTDADLTGADFRGSALCATTFKGAMMDGAKFGGAYYHGHDLADGELPDW